jgi:hypothetical protein
MIAFMPNDLFILKNMESNLIGVRKGDTYQKAYLYRGEAGG